MFPQPGVDGVTIIVGSWRRPPRSIAETMLQQIADALAIDGRRLEVMHWSRHGYREMPNNMHFVRGSSCAC
jgi:hypothetical protein